MLSEFHLVADGFAIIAKHCDNEQGWSVHYQAEQTEEEECSPG